MGLIIDDQEFIDQIGPVTFKRNNKGKKVSILILKGCERGNFKKIELRDSLLELMICGIMIFCSFMVFV